MASGKDHFLVNSFVGLTLSTSLYEEINYDQFLFITIGLFIGTIITPDYDLETILTKEIINKSDNAAIAVLRIFVIILFG